MSEFIRKTALFILLFIIPLVLFEVYVRTQWIDPFDAKRTFLENEKESCEVLVLGTSHAWAGLNPDWVSDNCINLANAFQPFFYDYKILERYGPEMEALHTVILPTSYTSFFNKPSDYHQNLYSIYWGLSPYGKRMLGDHSLVLSLGLKSLLERLINGENNFVNKGWLELKGNYDGAEDLAQKRLEMMHDVMNEENWEESVWWFEKIFDLANDHNWRVVLFYPPYSEKLNELLKDDLYKVKIDEYLEQLVESGLVEFYDFNDNEIFDNDYFKDADHLNTQGAHLLSRKMQEILSVSITAN